MFGELSREVPRVGDCPLAGYKHRKDREVIGLIHEIRKAFEYPLTQSKLDLFRERTDSLIFRKELQMCDDFDKFDDRI
jgi:hypothetical protein